MKTLEECNKELVGLTLSDISVKYPDYKIRVLEMDGNTISHPVIVTNDPLIANVHTLNDRVTKVVNLG